MSFPSTFTVFTYPQATDRLNSPSHSSVHGQVASSLGQVEAVLGVSGDSSVLGTVIGDLRSPGSKGGGHIQGVAFGGTGQTTYLKGDILVASGASTLSKLAVGTDSQIPSADSTKATGITWINSPSSKIYTYSSTIGAGASETSIFSTTVLASTLGTSNAIRVMSSPTFVLRTGGPDNVTIKFQYGGYSVSSIILAQATGGVDTNGLATINHTIIASTATLQKHIIVIDGSESKQGMASVRAGSTLGTMFRTFDVQYSSVSSGANQVIGMTAVRGANSSLTFDGITVEKIS